MKLQSGAKSPLDPVGFPGKEHTIVALSSIIVDFLAVALVKKPDGNHVFHELRVTGIRKHYICDVKTDAKQRESKSHHLHILLRSRLVFYEKRSSIDVTLGPQ